MQDGGSVCLLMFLAAFLSVRACLRKYSPGHFFFFLYVSEAKIHLIKVKYRSQLECPLSVQL